MVDEFISTPLSQSQCTLMNECEILAKKEMLMTDDGLIPLFPSTGVLHGLHGYEALTAVRHGQQSLLHPTAARGRALPS